MTKLSIPGLRHVPPIAVFQAGRRLLRHRLGAGVLSLHAEAKGLDPVAEAATVRVRLPKAADVTAGVYLVRVRAAAAEAVHRVAVVR